MKLLNEGFDHVEFVSRRIGTLAPTFERMGFQNVGARENSQEATRSLLYQQGRIRILITEPSSSDASSKSNAVKFLNAQDEGICVLALEVDNAAEWFQTSVARGARPALEPQTFVTPQGKVVRAEVWTPGNVRYAFIQRESSGSLDQPALFDGGLVAERLESPSPLNLYRIDHLTNNVNIGEMSQWVDFYKKCFGFTVTRSFKISTGRTGLISDVVESPCRRVKVPINEASEPASQVQEFCNRMKGSGVQHLALETTGLMDTLQTLRSRAFKFLKVPKSYYEQVPTRVPGVTEDLAELENLGILLDGETGYGKYLLQIFGEEILGPFFFEYIQRKGDPGFGEGNFNALFEAIERDQVRRGVLTSG